ncbi:hypothetical protein CLF_103849 [Clonorchis sinensis]|uniref:Uncharacterized protein n=1 Tax=Clonorchis sinensis TaxID=79923 RepID=G7YNN3_CLOSI|nr:hypothetical protein CLF_103849 [Clonorchis sinensis]
MPLVDSSWPNDWNRQILKQLRAKIVDNRRQTSDRAVQTVAQKSEGDFTRIEKPLIRGVEHKTQCTDEKFSLALIDIAFRMHEQLSCYQASRTAEDRKHEAFICELKNNYEKNLQALRRKYRVDLESFRKKIEEAAERHTNKLREEGKDLRRSKYFNREKRSAPSVAVARTCATHTKCCSLCPLQNDATFDALSKFLNRGRVRRREYVGYSEHLAFGKRRGKKALPMDTITVFCDVLSENVCEIRQDSRTYGTGTTTVPRKPHNKNDKGSHCTTGPYIMGSNGHIDTTHQEYDAFPHKGRRPVCSCIRKKSFSCSTLLVPNCHVTRKEHEGWDAGRLPKPK